MTATPVTPSVPSFEILPPGTRLRDRYDIESVVGQGGMATVYRALDTTLGRPVAVKVLNPHLSRQREFVEQFIDMERSVARLYHPNLVTIFDADVGEDGCYVVMEYVPGGTLRARLQTTSTLSPDAAIRIVAQVADALHVLHRERIIHGDVKPDNILLDDEDNAKIVDFGIAHIATTTGVIPSDAIGGTAPYLAPEQLDRGHADARADIYSLGLVAYEALAGRSPFNGDNWVAVATQRLTREPEPLSIYAPTVTPNVEQVIMRALSRDAGDRFQTADAFGRALRQAASAPISPRPSAKAPTDGDASPDVHVTGDVLWTRGTGGVDSAELPRSPKSGAAATPSRGDETTSPPGARLRRVGAARLRQVQDAPARTKGLWITGALVALLVLTFGLGRLLNPPRPAVTPSLVGLSLEDARRTARDAGLEVGAKDESAESIPRGVVLRQDPAPSTRTQTDRPVQIVVSSGPPPVKVPDLRNRPLDDARRDLAAAGLVLGKVEERETSRDAWGVVLGQQVKPGSELVRGSSVEVQVAVPPWTTVPKLLDRSIGDAEEDLGRRGLKLGEVNLLPDGSKRAGTVLDQQPAVDVRLRQGDSVSISISIPPKRP